MALERHAQLNCGNCDFARHRHATADDYARAERAGHPAPPLQCLRYPNAQPKSEGDMCGEHSELMEARALVQAEMIAIAIEKQSTAGKT